MPESALVTLLLAGRLLAAAPADLSPAITVAPQTLEASPRLVALSGSSVFHAPGEDQRRFLEQFCTDVVPKLRELG